MYIYIYTYMYIYIYDLSFVNPMFQHLRSANESFLTMAAKCSLIGFQQRSWCECTAVQRGKENLLIAEGSTYARCVHFGARLEVVQNTNNNSKLPCSLLKKII
mmetsp:Transcript_19619/g.27382  ORF Transcript_19619/g.27382 Transcript_19619/m.27382 type:complete len:103 (-) Transcript_19619:121-429(-)